MVDYRFKTIKTTKVGCRQTWSREGGIFLIGTVLSIHDGQKRNSQFLFTEQEIVEYQLLP